MAVYKNSSGGDVTNAEILPASVGLTEPPELAQVRCVALPFPSGYDSESGVDGSKTEVPSYDDLVVDTDDLIFVPGEGSNFTPRVATTAALPACTPAGAGIGKTLTANANGVLTVDGVATVLGDQILVKDQADPVDNGLYLVTVEGDAGTPFELTRDTGFDEDSEANPGGATFSINEGTVNGNTSWQLQGDPIYDGPLTFDGIEPDEGDRVLVVSVTGGSGVNRGRGVFVLTQKGVAGPESGGGQPNIYTRAADFNANADIRLGCKVPVNEGAYNAGISWILAPSASYSLGVTIFGFAPWIGTSIAIPESYFSQLNAYTLSLGNGAARIIVNDGAPSPGAGLARGGTSKGSLCLDIQNGDLYVNAGDVGAEDWKLVTRAA